MHLTIEELLGYTEDERAKWRTWFETQGNERLRIALHGETHPTVGALIFHCFGAELWYAFWMRGEIINEESEVSKKYKDMPTDDAARLFDFGEYARRELRDFAGAATAEDWERPREFSGFGFEIRGSARKLIAHILVHEVRHFAQIAAAVRAEGFAPPGDHDILFSPSFGIHVKKT